MSKLNQRQENYCLNIVQGMTQHEAYTKAGYKPGSNGNARANASELTAMPNIRQRIEELREPVVEAVVTSLKERLEIYSEMASLPVDYDKLSGDSKLKAKLESLHRLNQMERVYSDAPTQDQRTYNLILMSDSKEAETAIKRIMGGTNVQGQGSTEEGE